MARVTKHLFTSLDGTKSIYHVNHDTKQVFMEVHHKLNDDVFRDKLEHPMSLGEGKTLRLCGIGDATYDKTIKFPLFVEPTNDDETADETQQGVTLDNTEQPSPPVEDESQADKDPDAGEHYVGSST